jgi:ectoine hydroxylase-related dioxygenase (phytanoyl-CoA dioxygenase family)
MRAKQDEYFNEILGGTALLQSVAQALQNEGFVVIAGPVSDSKITELADCYVLAISQADGADVVIGGSTTRVVDFVNRGAAFDDLYLHAPVLEAAGKVIGQPFKLSSLVARTLNANKPAQKLHVDFPADDIGWPMLGFIFMVDDFRPENGATQFLPGSQGAKCPPAMSDGLVQACGRAGSMIIYNGAVWHGHAANVSASPRRSIQGAYIRRTEKSGFEFQKRMRAETFHRISPLAKYLLAL